MTHLGKGERTKLTVVHKGMYKLNGIVVFIYMGACSLQKIPRSSEFEQVLH